mgnify:CR=1 FL=1
MRRAVSICTVWVSESHLKYYNRRPRLPKSVYLKYQEGMMIGSACEAGELYQALLRKCTGY